MTIAVGGLAINRVGSDDGGTTYVIDYNPVNATGIITQVQIYSYVAMGGIKVAAFSASGNDLTTRGYANLPDQTAAGLSTFTAPADFTPFEIRASEWIGIYFDLASPVSGEAAIDSGPSTGNNMWQKSGDNIPCTGVTFDFVPNTTLSLNGSGIELGKINIGDSWKTIQNIKINIGDSWKQVCALKINVGDAWKTIDTN